MTPRRLATVAGWLLVGWCYLGGETLEGETRPKFRLPLNQDAPAHFFVSHDTPEGGIEAWNCADATYPSHRGTDFTGLPIGTEILSAAPGWLLYREDGYGDGDCTIPTRDLIPFGNHVRIYHGNGKSTLYAHMLGGTVINTGLFSFIGCGDHIGELGKSGYVCSSSQPPHPEHLHFEARTGVTVSSPQGGTYAEPYFGTCSDTVESLWVTQGSGGSPGIACAANPWEFAVGDCMFTTSAVNVREAPAGILTRQVPAGTQGTIIGGPTGQVYSGDNQFYVWWKVRWADGGEGWSQEGPLDSRVCSTSVPPAPTGLQQLGCDGGLVAIGGTIDVDTIRPRATVQSTGPGPVRLDIELRPRSQAFTGIATHSSMALTGGLATILNVTSLANGTYHWRARTRVDGSSVASQWVSAGGSDTQTDFSVASSACRVCTFGATSSATAGVCSPGLAVLLNPSTTNGTVPLNDVDLIASVSGEQGTINYTFYCDRDDAGVDITSGWAAKFDGINTNPKTALDVCDYSTPGSYTAKVIAERGASADEDRVTVTVTQPSAGGVPTVATAAAAAITQTSASLGMMVNPNGSTATAWSDWGPNTGVPQSTPSQGVGAGTASLPVSVSLSGLTCGSTYYFRARAQNGSGGASPGSVLSFSTAACGCGGTQSTELIQNGTFGADSASWTRAGDFYADRRFGTYHDSPGYAYLSQADGSAGDGLNGTIYQQVSIPSNATSAELSFWTRISTAEPTGGAAQDFLNATLQNSSGNFLAGLNIYSNRDASSTYVERTFNLVNFIGQTIRLHFLGTTNVDGQPTVFRVDDVSLMVGVPTGASPTVTTDAADQITATSARLNLSVDPNNATTTVWFDFDPNDSTPNTDTEHLVIGCGTQSLPASISVTDLACGTTYYFEANAENAHGTDDGTTRQFTTAACAGDGAAPVADTDPAVNLGENSATLTADVNANGLSTQAWFAWGATSSLGQETPHRAVGSEVGNVDFSEELEGLTCGTTYYFENWAQNSAGVDDGSTLTFDTLPCSGGTPTEGFLLENRRQACSGTAPAILLWWVAPTGAGSTFTVRRTDGGYVATVDAAQSGYAHLVTEDLAPGETYTFVVEGTVNGTSAQTNLVTVPVLSDECRLPIGESGLPHLPVAWADSPFCSGGSASVLIHWTSVGGADTYTLNRYDNAVAQTTTYANLTSTSQLDVGLIPGESYEYDLEAVGLAGGRRASPFTLRVPSGVCGEPSTPGPFTAQLSPVSCSTASGAVTMSWTASAGSSNSRHYFYSDDGVRYGSGSTTQSSKLISSMRPGALYKFMVQAESSSTPRLYRSALLAQRVPIDICGPGILSPTATTVPATYVQTGQALLRASVTPSGGATAAYFDWGTSPSYGSTTPTRNAGDGFRNVSVEETLSGLACDSTYYFRARASNQTGQGTGADMSFTTLPCSGEGCFPLSRFVNNANGGGLPVPSPLQSSGCPSGEYIAGEVIQVTASPASGWRVVNWSGTQNDGSPSMTNTVLMPSGPHSVQVNYAPGPIFSDGFEGGVLPGPWSGVVPTL